MLSTRKEGFIIRKTRRVEDIRTNQQRRHMSQTQFYRKSSPPSIRSPGHIVHINEKEDNDNSYLRYTPNKAYQQLSQTNPEHFGIQVKYDFQQSQTDLKQLGEVDNNLQDKSFEQLQVDHSNSLKLTLKVQQNIKLAKILQKLQYQMQHRQHSSNILQCVKLYMDHVDKFQLSIVNNLTIPIIRKKILKESLTYQRFSICFIGFVQVVGKFQEYKSYLGNLVTFSYDNLLLRLAILSQGKEKTIVEFLKQEKKEKLLNKNFDTIKNNNQILHEAILKVSNVEKPFNQVFKKLHKQNKIMDAKNQFHHLRQFIAYYLCQIQKTQIAPFLAMAPAPYIPPQQFQKYTLVIDIFECMLSKNKKSVQVFRPFAQYFLDQMSQYYEIVSFSDALPNDGNKIINLLDRKKLIKYRLFRHHLNKTKGPYSKDLARLGRDMDKIVVIDTIKEPENWNTIVLNPWKGRKNDAQLAEICPILAMISLKKLQPQKAIKKLQEKNEENSKIGLKYMNCGVNLQ